VIEAIQERRRQGLPLAGISRADSGLYQAGIKHFESWDNAMLAANVKPTYRRWTKQRVIDEIRDRHDRGLSMHGIAKDDRGLYQASVSRFGSWPKALAAAGLTFRRWSRPQEWTRERVLQGIRDRHRQGRPMNRTWCEDSQLYDAAKSRFGGWQKALLAVGIESRPRQRWTKQRVLEAIRFHDKQGHCFSQVCKDNYALYIAATRRFGNWQNAVEAAGFEVKRARRWSKESVLATLRSWDRSPDVDLRKVDPGLVGAAFRRFGGLLKALEAAGVEPRNRWTKQRLIRVIQDGYVRGLPIEFAGFKNIALAAAATRRFGSWSAALHAAGISWQPPPPKKKWNPQKVIQCILTHVEAGNALNKVWQDDRRLHAAARNHFGSWNEALSASGLKPTQSRKRQSKEAR
jgi:hypothetical protein